jgi:2-amino-4-hydroxy-6-hydroxymethyldihydropteridine diphosphokinase
MNAPHWWPVYVGVGSNLDNPEKQVRQAITALGNLPGSILVSESGLYRSAPLGPVEQPDFVNAVVGLLTQTGARDLLRQMHEIEQQQGRERDGETWGPRTLDLDLLAYAGQIVEGEDLVVPHPGIAERNFVLLPWREIAANYRVPGLAEVVVLAAKVSGTEPRIERIG